MTLLLFGGFGALYFGADWMVRGAARLQGSLGLSPIVIGLTVVSLGTSAPELIVAVLATLRGNCRHRGGERSGSNLANIGLILGASALVRPLLVAERVVRRDVPIMILLTLFLFPLIIDLEVGRLDGAVLTLFMGIYLTYVFYRGRKVPKPLIPGYAQLAGEVGSGKEGGLLTRTGPLWWRAPWVFSWGVGPSWSRRFTSPEVSG